LEVFQSHAGSIEAIALETKRLVMAEFQSHAGSIEAGGSSSADPYASWFQSHAGSIEAATFMGTPFRRKPVSIPRWFD